MKDIWNKFTAWLSGWPESKERKSEKELAHLFEEEELKTKAKVKKKPKGLNSKKKKSRGKK